VRLGDERKSLQLAGTLAKWSLFYGFAIIPSNPTALIHHPPHLPPQNQDSRDPIIVDDRAELPGILQLVDLQYELLSRLG